MTMSASPLRAASRWLDASRSTSSTRTPTPASCAWIAWATRDNSTFVPVRHSCRSIPLEYPASAMRARAAAGSYPYPRRVVSLPASPGGMAPCARTPRPPYTVARISGTFTARLIACRTRGSRSGPRRLFRATYTTRSAGFSTNWSGRALRQVAGGRRRHDARHRHREELGKDRQRLGERERDARVPMDRNAAHVTRAPGSVRFSPGDGVQRPRPTPFGRGGQDAQHAGAHRGGREGGPVVELDARSQVKHVPPAIPVVSRRPAIGQRRKETAIRVELGESVERERHHLTGRHVGREGGIERARVVGFVVREASSRARAILPAGRGSCEGGESKTEEHAHGIRCRKG